ncbi:class I SAM-dependent methyltransferase [Pelagibacteraceae bacterium]|nr:class I SAM-dependent methyltransferase [Pelagibacteraceae bacterium]
MKLLKNWDNKTWLSSNKYINFFCKFLISKSKINKKTKILDIGCGRANIISKLQKIYKFHERPVGIDVIKNDNIKKNINFLKTDAIKYLKKFDKKYDIILIKQTIHFFSKKDIKTLLNLIKKRLKKNGQLLIFSIRIKKNEIPVFKKMNTCFKKSIEYDKTIFKEIKKILKKISINHLSYKVVVLRNTYVKMLKKRYISCLLKMTDKELIEGAKEIKLTHNKRITFCDKLTCVIYKN